MTKKRTTKPAAPLAGDTIRAPIPAPETLSPGAVPEWNRLIATLAELGTATHADLRALELLSECLATESKLRAVLDRDGLTIPGADGNLKTHPASKLLESTRNQCHRLLSDFGLIPRGRVTVKAAPKIENNPWDDIVV